jgi:Asp-tRNA(Asn)/Glu-tRNA(Gln) amidotransferase A subunit family amidase
LVAPSNMSLPTVLESPETAASDVKPPSASSMEPSMELASARYAFVGNLTGVPALSIPCGLSSGAPTLPTAIQFYAAPFNESALLRVGHAYQSVTDWHRRRPVDER